MEAMDGHIHHYSSNTEKESLSQQGRDGGEGG